jgi:hypothetical protein
MYLIEHILHRPVSHGRILVGMHLRDVSHVHVPYKRIPHRACTLWACMSRVCLIGMHS